MADLFYCQAVGDSQFLCERLIDVLKTFPECAFQYRETLPECDIDYFTFLPSKKYFAFRYDLVYGQSIESAEQWSADEIEALQAVFQRAVASVFDFIFSDSHVFGKISDQAIICAEKELGVSFPGQYRYLLNHFGAVAGNGYEIYGLPTVKPNECPLWRNVVQENLRLRRNKQIGSENHDFIAISDDGMGSYYFINTEVLHWTEIWAINPCEQKIVANDLFEFMAQMARDVQAA